MWRDGLVGAPNAGMIGTSLSTGLMTSAVCGTASSHDRGASMYQMHRSTAHPPRTPWKGFACTGTPLRSATSGLPSALHEEAIGIHPADMPEPVQPASGRSSR